MEKKHRFLIYDRKEVGVLLLLGVMVAVFAFTLGVHLGKRVGGKSAASHPTSEAVAPVADASPPAPEDEHAAQPSGSPSNVASGVNEELINQASHEEVARTGVKLDETRQLELPEATRAKNAGATTGAASEHSEHAENSEHKTAHSAPQAKAPAKKSKKAAHGKYTLQIGSYAAQAEAETRMKDLQISGLRPRIHEAEVEGKGRWYRIYVGGFATKDQAEKAGLKYRAQGMIDSFIVAKSVD